MPADTLEPRSFRFSISVGVLERDDIEQLRVLIDLFVTVLGSLRPEGSWSCTKKPGRLSIALQKNGEVYAQGFMEHKTRPPLSVVKP